MTESKRRIIVFRNRVRPEVSDAYGPRADAMQELAQTMPGFISSKDFVAEDGERLALIEFASADELAAWRDHPEHRAAQAEGRERWYSEYLLQVCELLKESRFSAPVEADTEEIDLSLVLPSATTARGS